MQYQHEDMNHWGVPVPAPVASSSASAVGSEIGGLTTNSGGDNGNGVITTSCANSISAAGSPTDSENNNQPIKHAFMSQGKPDSSPLHAGPVNSTVSAAADSSDNQPSTPTPETHSAYNSNNQQMINSYEMQQQQPQHPYPGYMNNYEQYYHPPSAPTALDYGNLHHQPQQQQQQQPMFGNHQAQEYKPVPSARFHPYMNNGHHNNPANNSSSISNSSLSPRVVSSSSPSHNALLTQNGDAAIQPGTPSPPKQCDKCGYVCSTDAQLNEHYATAHAPTTPAADSHSITREEGNSQNQFSYAPYAIKEEPGSDILDLDSQKMVYPPQPEGDGLPPMHGMHPLHRPLAWSQEMYMPQQQQQPDIKQPFFSPIKQAYPPVIKSEYPPPGPQFPQMAKPEFNIPPQTRPEVKPFLNTELPTGNLPASSSPSEFPSTTTPQDSQYQQRFEPPTSSLPNNTSTTKSATWKSNEARRPKTYNCTACNKWFTSSGHLKRHYNTTLHKNAVKSSGQPDPATMPISVHHHPTRDPNSKHHRGQNKQPPPAPPEPPRSPEYTPQFAGTSPNGFGQPQQSFQQQQQSQFQHQTAINSNGNGHPNGLAGPSVHASQPRGLLNISTTTEVTALDQEDPASSNSHLREDHHQQQYHLQLQEYQTLPQQQLQLQQQQPVHIISHHPYREVHHMDTIFTTPTTIHNIMAQQPPQQPYIINPLGINTTTTPITHSTTTIPSFQHLQLQADHQGSYHTIIGNDSQIANNSDNVLQLGSSFDLSMSNSTGSSPSPSSSPQPLPPIHTTSLFRNHPHHQLHHHQPQPQPQQMTTMMTTDGVMLPIDQSHQELAELQRLSGGVPMYHEKVHSPLYSPAVPESTDHNRISPFINQGSPQEADLPPAYTLASVPIPSANYPYSPTISSSTVTTTTHTSAKPKSAKRKRDADSSPTTPPGKIECVECDKEFAKICYLTQHNKTFHSGEQPFRCQKCGKRFQTEDVYELHLQRHKSQDKPYKCDVCPKQFHHKTDLRRHKEAIHTGFKAHICETCNKSFCRKDHLRKHSDTHNRVKGGKKAKANKHIESGDEVVMGL